MLWCRQVADVETCRKRAKIASAPALTHPPVPLFDMPSPELPRERHLFYISRSLATPEQTEQILAHARDSNRRRGVTGALLFTGGHFAQVLEGSAEALAATIAAIEADSRHEAVTRLIEGDITQRRFADWTMALIEAAGADDLIQQLLAAPEIPAERAARILKLMFESPLR